MRMSTIAFQFWVTRFFFHISISPSCVVLCCCCCCCGLLSCCKWKLWVIQRQFVAVAYYIWAVRCHAKAKMACKAYRSHCAVCTRRRVRWAHGALIHGWVFGPMAFCSRMLTRIANKWPVSFPSNPYTIVRLCVKCWYPNAAIHIQNQNFCRSIHRLPERHVPNIRPYLRPYYVAPPASRCSSAMCSFVSGRRPPMH